MRSTVQCHMHPLKHIKRRGDSLDSAACRRRSHWRQSLARGSCRSGHLGDRSNGSPCAGTVYRKVPISGFIDTVLILPVVNLYDSSLSNGEQPKERAASRASEFLLVERAIVIFIGGLEQLLDNGQKLVLVERAVAIAVYTYAWIDGR